MSGVIYNCFSTIIGDIWLTNEKINTHIKGEAADDSHVMITRKYTDLLLHRQYIVDEVRTFTYCACVKMESNNKYNHKTDVNYS